MGAAGYPAALQLVEKVRLRQPFPPEAKEMFAPGGANSPPGKAGRYELRVLQTSQKVFNNLRRRRLSGGAFLAHAAAQHPHVNGDLLQHDLLQRLRWDGEGQRRHAQEIARIR